MHPQNGLMKCLMYIMEVWYLSTDIYMAQTGLATVMETGAASTGIPERKFMKSTGNVKAQLFQPKVCFMYMMKRTDL